MKKLCEETIQEGMIVKSHYRNSYYIDEILEINETCEGYEVVYRCLYDSDEGETGHTDVVSLCSYVSNVVTECKWYNSPLWKVMRGKK